MLPCIDKGNRVRSDVSGKSGTDRCFQSHEYGRMVPPDAAERWKKAQKFETSLWAKNSGSEDRIHTHEVGFDYFKASNKFRIVPCGDSVDGRALSRSYRLLWP